MNPTEQSLARIFAICDHVAETGEMIRTEKEGRETARDWLGFENAIGEAREDNATPPHDQAI